MAKDRINVGLSKETHKVALKTCQTLGIDLQVFVDSAVQKFVRSKKAITSQKLKDEAREFAAAA